MTTSTLTITLPTDLRDRLADAAYSTQRTEDDITADALRIILDDYALEYFAPLLTAA